MKKFNIKILFGCYVIVGVLSLLFFRHERFWYDLVLRYFNFGIIVFVFIKYAKTPLMDFLRGRKETLAREIKKIEDKKKEAIDRIDTARKTLEESQERFTELKERIVHQGEKKKQELVNQAHHLSRVMIEDAKRKI